MTPTRDLRESWEALKAHRGEPESNAATTAKLEEALKAAAKDRIPERDLDLIEAGQLSACCCNATPIEIWCAFTFDDTEKR